MCLVSNAEEASIRGICVTLRRLEEFSKGSDVKMRPSLQQPFDAEDVQNKSTGELASVRRKQALTEGRICPKSMSKKEVGTRGTCHDHLPRLQYGGVSLQ